MKAVLISIQPQHCANITSGKKTVELRKRKPKLETPFKCYIYETKKEIDLHRYEVPFIGKDGKEKDGIHEVKWIDRSGKVIGEFVCDKIDKYVNHFMAWRDKNGKQFNVGEFLSNACLTLDEVSNYIAGSIKFYG